MVILQALAPPADVTVDQVWSWLGEVADPEIPVLSIVDLGIVRKVELLAGCGCIVTLTPTYSGCPAMAVIAEAVSAALRSHGMEPVRLVQQLAPAWTTDWLSERGRRRLRDYGIAPPAQQVIDISGLIGTGAGHGAGSGASLGPGLSAGLSAGLAASLGADISASVRRRALPKLTVLCPACASAHTQLISQFGSTPCKALYKCLDCREPFDYFKCH